MIDATRIRGVTAVIWGGFIVVGGLVFKPYLSSSNGVWVWILITVLAIGELIIVLVIRRTQNQLIRERLRIFTEQRGWTVQKDINPVTLLPPQFIKINGILRVKDTRRQRVAQRGSAWLFPLVYDVAAQRTNQTETRVLVVLVSQLSGMVNGVVRALPANTPWLHMLPENSDLESHTFNEHVHLIARPRKMATYVFSPDFMQWYLEQKPRPMIHIEQDKLCLALTAEPSLDDVERLVNQSEHVLEFLKHSGALDPAPL